MKNLPAFTLASLPLWVSGPASAQSGHMMDGSAWGGGWMGGYGGCWMPVLLIVIVGLLAWIVMQRRK